VRLFAIGKIVYTIPEAELHIPFCDRIFPITPIGFVARAAGRGAL